jgi:hypothetical protein
VRAKGSSKWSLIEHLFILHFAQNRELVSSFALSISPLSDAAPPSSFSFNTETSTKVDVFHLIFLTSRTSGSDTNNNRSLPFDRFLTKVQNVMVIGVSHDLDCESKDELGKSIKSPAFMPFREWSVPEVRGPLEDTRFITQ